MTARIAGIGAYVPENLITNADLAKIVDTNDEWIRTRTGIRERRISSGEGTRHLAAKAAERALAAAGVAPEELDIIILGTSSPDRNYPSDACSVQAAIGAVNAVAFDISAACAGFIFAMNIVEGFFKAGIYKTALIIGAETLSKVTDWSDRGTCVLFGDGAGAAVLESDENERGILSTYIKNYDDVKGAIKCKANYINPPFWEDDLTPQPLFMKGRAVFKFAVNAIDEVTKGALEETGLTCDDVDWFVLHQANGRIIQAAAQKLGQPIEKFQISIQDGGNVSSATVPMALYDLNLTQKMKKGDIIALVGFGGGLCAAAAIIEW